MFISHRNDLEKNHYDVLTHNKKWIWLQGKEGPKLISNVCPHQGSLISLCKGDLNVRTCPYHGKKFDHDGKGKNTNLCLETKPIYTWKGLNLSQEIDVPSLESLNLNHYVLIEKRTDKVKANRQNIVDLFLDVDHIPFVHEGVYDEISITEEDVKNIVWEYYDWGSVQLVSVDGEIKAAWITMYPGTMIEYQNDSLFITVAGTTQQDGWTYVHVFKYKNMKKDQQLYDTNSRIWEDAWAQDRMQAEMIVESPLEENLEESKLHYRKWLNGVDTK